MPITIRPYRGDTTGKAWEADIMLIHPATGARIRKRRRCPVTSRSAAQRWADQYARTLLSTPQQSKKEDANAKPQEIPTFKEFVSRWWVEHVGANQIRTTTRESYRFALDVHLLPFFGGDRLDAITTARVQEFKGRAANGLAPSTLNHKLKILKVILRCASTWGVIGAVPVIKSVKVPKRRQRFYSPEEIVRLVDSARSVGTVAELAVLLGADAGLRVSEMIALSWTSIDFERNILMVEERECRGDVDVPKSGNFRELPLTKRLREALVRYRHLIGPRVLYIQRRQGGQGWRTVTDTIVSREFHAAREAAGLDRITIHGLRHSFLSNLAALGVAARELQALAGHHSLETTEGYLHLRPGATADAIARLDACAVHASGEIMEENSGTP